MEREGYEGSGPGVFSPDGCNVDLYLRLPVGTEPDVIGRSAAAGASILELGSGVGRVTRPLVLSSEPVGDGVRSVLVEYEFPDARWTHRFRSRPLTDAEFTALLDSAGLAVDEYLTPDRTWVRAGLAR